MSKLLWDTKAVADFLSVSPNTIRKQRTAGGPLANLPSIKIGPRMVRYNPEQVKAWVGNLQSGGSADV